MIWSRVLIKLKKKPREEVIMYSRVDIAVTETSFSFNSRRDDRFNQVRANEELSALRRNLYLQKRTVEAARIVADMIMAWMHSFQKKKIAST